MFWAAAAGRWILGDSVVPWDSKNQFYAFFRFLSAALHAGEWPLWNPYHYGGFPSVADPQSLVLSPVFVLWAALDPAPTMHAFDIVVLAHLLVGGLAIAIIGWRASWPVAACVLAAALFMFGGAAAGRLQHTGIILSYGLFPPALLLLQLSLERRSHALALAFALVAALMALGRSQVALLLCALLLAAASAEIVQAGQPLPYLRRRAGVLATMAAAGGALLAVPLLLTMQFAGLSNRGTEPLDDALRGSLHPSDFANLAVPRIFGLPAEYWGPGARTLPDVALIDPSFSYVFVGAVTVLLLLWFGIAGGRLWRPGRRLMAATLAVATLFMLGRYTPLYTLVFEWVPGIDLFRRPTDGSFVFGIALALLAGHLLADYLRDGLPRLRLIPTAVATGLPLAVIGSALLFSARTGHAWDAARAAAVAALIMLAAAVILIRARDGRARSRAAGLVVLIAIAELYWWNAASPLNAEPRSYYAVLEAPTGADAAAIARLDAALAEDHAKGERPRVEVLGLGGAWQNLAMVRGWEATNGYNPLRIGAYDRLVAPGEENWAITLRKFPPSFPGYDSPLARALGLTYLVLGQPIERLPQGAAPRDTDVLLAGPPIWIYRLRGALPRASLSGGSASIVSSALGRIEIRTSATAPGLLTLHDIDYPGWTAEIDGRPAPIRKTELLFRGVEVRAGEHRVTFRFAPFSLGNLRDALDAARGRSQ